MAISSKKRKIKRKKITLVEFKAWLEGIEELQPDDWTPSADQWALIRDKMLSISEPAQSREQPLPQQTMPSQSPILQQHGAAPVRQFTPPPTALPVREKSNANERQLTLTVPEMTPAALAATSGNLPISGTVPSDTTKISTPNIDTSSGEYDSGFV